MNGQQQQVKPYDFHRPSHLPDPAQKFFTGWQQQLCKLVGGKWAEQLSFEVAWQSPSVETLHTEPALAQLPEDATLPTDMVLNIGIRLYNEGNTAKALEYFDRAVAEAPDNPEGYYYRGLTSLGLGNNDQAKADFTKLLDMAPDNAHATEVKEYLKFLEGGS